jgi:hypothetical protein
MNYIFSINDSTIKLSLKDKLIKEINKFDISDIKVFIDFHGDKIKEEEKERLEKLLLTLIELKENGVSLKDLHSLIILIKKKSDLEFNYFTSHTEYNTAQNNYLGHLNKKLEDIKELFNNIPEYQYENIDKIENLFGNLQYTSFEDEVKNKINHINKQISLKRRNKVPVFSREYGEVEDVTEEEEGDLNKSLSQSKSLGGRGRKLQVKKIRKLKKYNKNSNKIQK